MNNTIVVEQLSYRFGQIPVLGELSFKVEAGEFFIIIGPNGSGKTTLLKLLIGLLPIQTGNIQMLSHSIHQYTPRALARRAAYVPQISPVEFSFSVTQVVLMGRAPYLGMLGFESTDDFDLAQQAMVAADVAHLAERRLDQLSGGEQQRVFIARAICQAPRIMLLDEPTASLDLRHQVHIMDMLELLKREQGTTVVMISHDLNLAAMYADRLLLLSQGRLAGLGPPDEIMDYCLLEKVYGCPLVVDQSALGRYPRVHLVPGRYLS